MLLSIDVDETKLPVGEPYPADWSKQPHGSFDLWLPIRDINGLSEASTALFRCRNRDFKHVLPPDALAQRIAMIDIAKRIIDAERELQLKEFRKLLEKALDSPA